MATTTVSENFKIAIPKELRAELHIRPGQKIEIVQSGNRLELVPVGPIGKARGFLRGIQSTEIKRDLDRL